MNNPRNAGLQSRFEPGRWVTILVVIFVLVFGTVSALYRHSLPTDGWAMGEAGDVTFLRNLAGLNPQIQRGDVLVSVEGIPAGFESIGDSDLLKRVQAGKTLTYHINRGGEDLDMSVVIGHWPSGSDFWAAYLTPGEIFNLISTIIQFGLAVFIFFRKPNDPASGSLLLTMATFASLTITEVIPFGYITWLDPTADFLQTRLANILLMSLFPYSIVRFAMTFPRPKPVYLRFPWLPVAVGAVGLALVVLLPNSPFSWFWFVLSFVSAIGILVHNAFTMRDAVSQAQIRWGVGGFVLGFGTLALMFLLNTTGIVTIPQESFDVVGSWVFMIMIAMIAVAILRYRLYDIDVIIRRTIQYTLVTGILALTYFGGIVIIQGILGPITGSESSPIVTVITTLGIAASSIPYATVSRILLTDVLSRQKYDAEQTLARFAATARDDVDMDKLTAALLGVVEETMQPEKVSLWLKAKGK